jgi:hypothetical protein
MTDYHSNVSRDDGKGGAFKIMAQIFRTTLHLPARIQAVCWAQFWAWIGWLSKSLLFRPYLPIL